MSPPSLVTAKVLGTQCTFVSYPQMLVHVDPKIPFVI